MRGNVVEVGEKLLKESELLKDFFLYLVEVSLLWNTTDLHVISEVLEEKINVTAEIQMCLIIRHRFIVI